MKKSQKIGYMALGAVIALTLSITTPALASSVQRQITAYYNNIKIYIDGELITPKDVNGNIVEPFVSEGTTYLPVRAVGEAFGKTVEWDGVTQSVFIGPRPGSVQYITDILSAYQDSGWNTFKEYSALKSGGAERFEMGGITYTNGFTIIGRDAWAVWNLNSQFSSLSGVLGRVPCRQDVASGTVIQVWMDGILRDEWAVSADMLPRNVTLDLRGVNQLKIEIVGWNGGTFGVGNPVLK
jgi:hypothetical protein